MDTICLKYNKNDIIHPMVFQGLYIYSKKITSAVGKKERKTNNKEEEKTSFQCFNIKAFQQRRRQIFDYIEL